MVKISGEGVGFVLAGFVLVLFSVFIVESSALDLFLGVIAAVVSVIGFLYLLADFVGIKTFRRRSLLFLVAGSSGLILASMFSGGIRDPVDSYLLAVFVMLCFILLPAGLLFFIIESHRSQKLT